MASPAATRPTAMVSLITFLLLAAALVGIYWEAIGNLLLRWGQQEELSHSYFIPVVSLWLLWERREALLESVGAPSLWGALVILLSLSLLVLGKMTHIFLLQHIALCLSVAGLVALWGGISLLRAAAFPVGYLLFMIPPPYWIITVTSWQFQLWSSELGVWMVRLLDIPVLLNGNVIDLGVTQLQVVEACSGLRYLFPFLSIAAIAAYLYRSALWQRIFVFLAAIPITVLMNSVRIALTAVFASRGDSSHTEGFLHFFEGWVVFLLCIALLAAVMFVLAKVSQNRVAFAGFGAPDVMPVERSGSWAPGRVTAIASLTLIPTMLGLLLVYKYEPQPIEPEREPLSYLNFSLSKWRLRSARLDIETEQVLGADDYIVGDMSGPNGEYMNLYVAYMDAQRDGNSWHSPRQCLPGGGWKFIREEVIHADMSENNLGHEYNRIIMEQNDEKLLVYYWYQQRGRWIADEIEMKLWLIWDIATKQRSDGAMVRVMTRIGPDEEASDADARLSFFINDSLAPELPRHVPL